MSWARGKLTRKTVYDTAGNQVAQTAIGYSNYGNQTSNIGQSGYQWIVGRWGGFLYVNCGNSVDGKELTLMNLAKTTGNYKETNRMETLNFGANAQSTTTTKAFNSTYLQPTYEEQLVSSNPEIVRTTYRYPFDIVNTSTTYTGLPNALKQMLLKNMFAYPVEQYTYVKQTSASNQEIISGQVTEFDLISGTSYYQPKYLYFLETATSLGSISNLQLSGTSAFTKDSGYKLRLIMDSYDTRGNLLQYSQSDGQTKSFLYAYDGAYMVAEASNAGNTAIAYTSFETNEKGGWTYSGSESLVMPDQAKTGNQVYLLNNGSITKTLNGASSTNKYKVSFWARANSGTVNWTFLGTSESLGSTWKLIEREVDTSPITISGTGVVIDELRIHPVSAQMTTYTMIPLIGIRSLMDVKSQGNYYQYDPFGRLETVRNKDGHILSHNEYNYIKP